MKVDNEYQKFFRHERFTHHITLPPSYLNEKSVLPVLRKIEFKLNKTFLKSAFSKYAKTDTFRFFIFPEDKNIDNQHFHILLFSPYKRDKEFNKEHCIACRFREQPFFETCPHCTTRVLYQLIKEELPTVDNVVVTICEETDYYSNTYSNKKQKFRFEYDDSYLVC
jgi:hypothetical protein|tara:strand:- start:18 stop:515 length:498 start_codon:yes stop_codon:yes gene_type:complete